MQLLFLRYFALQKGYVLYAALQEVSFLYGAYACGCSCEDIVAFVEGEILGKISDEGIEGKDEVCGVAVLDDLVVFSQLKMDVIGIREFLYRYPLADGCRAVEPFGNFPGLAFGLQAVLQVAGSEVYADGDGIVVATGKFGLYGSAIFAYPQDNFAFVVQVLGKIGVIEPPVVEEQRSRGFHEHHWLGGGHGIIELFGMIGVVTSYAKYFHDTVRLPVLISD